MHFSDAMPGLLHFSEGTGNSISITTLAPFIKLPKGRHGDDQLAVQSAHPLLGRAPE